MGSVMSHRVVYVPESEASPVGKAWKHYWRAREKDATKKARRYISQEKSVARRKLHRQLRQEIRRQLKYYCS